LDHEGIEKDLLQTPLLLLDYPYNLSVLHFVQLQCPGGNVRAING
jgi:hypothetical protein